MMITKRALSRRTVLRSLGAAVSLPLLDAMVPPLTAMQLTPAGSSPGSSTAQTGGASSKLPPKCGTLVSIVAKTCVCLHDTAWSKHGPNNPALRDCMLAIVREVYPGVAASDLLGEYQ